MRSCQKLPSSCRCAPRSRGSAAIATAIPTAGRDEVLHGQPGHLAEVGHRRLAAVVLPVRVGHERRGRVERHVPRRRVEALRVRTGGCSACAGSRRATSHEDEREDDHVLRVAPSSPARVRVDARAAGRSAARAGRATGSRRRARPCRRAPCSRRAAARAPSGRRRRSRSGASRGRSSRASPRAAARRAGRRRPAPRRSSSAPSAKLIRGRVRRSAKKRATKTHQCDRRCEIEIHEHRASRRPRQGRVQIQVRRIKMS